MLEHIDAVLPTQASDLAAAQARLTELDRQSDKLLEAHYADAVRMEHLRREQTRIAAARAAAETFISRAIVSEERLLDQLDQCCRLLSRAQQHYLAAEPTVRRDLNQGVFTHLYIDDDDMVGSDLTPPFQKLMSDSLSEDLVSERKRHQSTHVRTSDLYVVPEVGAAADRGADDAVRDLPGRAHRTPPGAQERTFPRRERHRGALPWEAKNPGPVKVQGSKDLPLVVLTRLTLNTPVTLRPPSGRVRRPVSRRVTRRQRDRVVELYSGGMSSRAVAHSVGVGRTTVLQILRARGVELRPQGAH